MADKFILVAQQAEIAFRPLTAEEVNRYLDLSEWQGSAGSYLLESRGVHLMQSVVGDHFTVLIIPHTLDFTTWGERRERDRLNIEVDLMARYAARLAERT